MRFRAFMFGQLLWWGTIGVSFGQVGGSADDLNGLNPVTKVQPTQHLVWEVSHPGMSHEAYIFGYLYMVPQDHFFLPPELHSVVQKSDRLIMEVDPLTNVQDYLLRGSVPFDSTLEALMPRKEYQQLVEWVRDSLTHKSLQQLAERYPPAYLSRQFLCDYCLAGPLGNQKVVSYEDYLRQAITLPIETFGTAWTRKSIYERNSIPEQIEVMQETMIHRNSLCKTYDRMLYAYRKQDLDEVWLLSQAAPDLGHNGGQFIEARNESWIPTIVDLLQYENLLVAVHAQQLPGEYGLLHQLRKRGFVVNPVFSP